MASGNIGQHETIQNKISNNNNDTQQDDSSTALENQYSVGDICMVIQTSKCLQFHTARIQKISVSTVAVIYLSTNEQSIVPMGPQMKSSEQVGRGIERRKVRQSNAINPVSVFVQGISPEERIDAHTRYVNNFNEWKKQSLTKIGFAK